MTTPAASPATPASPANGAAKTNGAPAPSSSDVAKTAGQAAPVPAPPAGAEVDPFATALKSKPWSLKRKDGREVRIENTEHLRALASQGFSASQEIEQTRAERAEARRVTELAERARKGDRAALRELAGEGFRGAAEQEAIEAYQEDLELKGVPEHIRARLIEAKHLAAEKAQRAAADAQAEQQRQAYAQQTEMQTAWKELGDVGVKALQAVGFPTKPPDSVVLRMAPFLAEAYELGLGPEHAAQMMREDAATEMQALTSGFVTANDAEGLEKFVGEKVGRMLALLYLARKKRAGAAPITADGSARPPPQQDPNKPREKTPEELRAWLREGRGTPSR